MGVLPRDLLVATTNSGKLAEISMVLGSQFRLKGLADAGITTELSETSGTISGNAAQKAMQAWDMARIDTLADDSGLEVEALDGKPGVDSAYFAGHPRNDQRNLIFLLDQMEGVINRKACFITVLALVEGGSLHLFEGRVYGNISTRIKGSHGFGYDPVFIPTGLDKTFAEMSIEEKNRISHRAVALQKLCEYLGAGRF